MLRKTTKTKTSKLTSCLQASNKRSSATVREDWPRCHAWVCQNSRKASWCKTITTWWDCATMLSITSKRPITATQSTTFWTQLDAVICKSTTCPRKHSSSWTTFWCCYTKRSSTNFSNSVTSTVFSNSSTVRSICHASWQEWSKEESHRSK